MKISIFIGSVAHVLEIENGNLDLREYPQAGKAVLKSAYDAGDWQHYEPLTPPTMPVEADPKAFKVALMSDALFLQWQLDLPPIQREDMKLAAMADNWELAQAIYSQLKAAIITPTDGPAQWQALADAHAIPLTF